MAFWVWIALMAGALTAGVVGTLRGKRDDAGAPFLGAAIFGGIAWMICLAIANSGNNEVVTEAAWEKDLVALNDAPFERSELGGAFVLVVGTVSGETDTVFRYTWYERSADGGLRLRSEDADSDEVTIYEDVGAGEDPKVIALKEREEMHTADWAAPFDVGFDATTEAGYELHVPPRTVVRDFELDAK